MTTIIYLDQTTAACMTDAKEALRIYSARNRDGKFDEAIERYKQRYKNWMRETLDTKVAA